MFPGSKSSNCFCISFNWKGKSSYRKVLRHLEHSTPTYKSFFGGHIEAICDATTAVCATKLQEAVSELKTFLRTADPELEGASVLDVEVTCNGTWAKRGYTSLYGCVFVVSVDTGKVLDFEIMSKYCKSCEVWSKCDPESLEYKKNGKCIMKQSAQLTFRTHQRLWKLQVQSSCGSDLSKRMVCDIHRLLEMETVHHRHYRTSLVQLHYSN